MDKSRILYISKTSLLSSGGGGEERARQVLSRLSDKHTITVISANTDPGLEKWTEWSGADIRHVRTVPDSILSTRVGFYAPRYLFGILCLPVLAWLLVVRDYDVVVENMTPYPTLTVLLTRLFDIPTIGVRHEFDGSDAYDNYDPISATILLGLQNLLRIASYAAIITPTDHVASQLEAYGVPQDRLYTVPNGIDMSPYKRIDQIPTHDNPSEEYTIATVSRLVRQKGVARLLRSFKQLRDRRDDVHLEIAGDGPQRESLESQAEAWGIAEHVSFKGFIPEKDKPDFLARADVFALASRREGFGLVLLEAMAAGTPAVAWDQPVFHEFFCDGAHGHLAKSTDEMAEAIDSLLTNPDSRKEMGQSAHHRARDFSWDRTANETDEVLSVVLS